MLDSHLHHRILKETGVPRKAAWVIYALAFGLCMIAMTGVFFEEDFSTMIFVLILLTFFVMIRYASIELFDTLTCVGKGLQIPHRNLILTALHPLTDGLIVVLALTLTRYWCFGKFFQNIPAPLLYFTHTAPFVLLLCLSGIYRTFWLRAGIIQYYKLLRLLAIAGVSGYILNTILCIYHLNLPQQEVELYTSFYALFLLLTMAGIMFERFLIHFYESWGYKRLFIRNLGKISALKQVLIYGGGLLCRIYVSHIFCGFPSKRENIKVIGIIDDDTALRGLNVYGFNILGSLNDLEDIFRKTPFDSIVVTCSEMDAEKTQILRDFCKAHNVELELMVCGVEKFQE